jgi:hypothetical protein
MGVTARLSISSVIAVVVEIKPKNEKQKLMLINRKEKRKVRTQTTIKHRLGPFLAVAIVRVGGRW